VCLTHSDDQLVSLDTQDKALTESYIKSNPWTGFCRGFIMTRASNRYGKRKATGACFAMIAVLREKGKLISFVTKSISRLCKEYNGRV